MYLRILHHLDRVLFHLYINPLEKCNLRCKICYTRKTSPILTEDDILTFISRYQKVHRLDTITFCGGEVFTLTYFSKLTNYLTQKDIFIQIITNGTIDKLEEFTKPNSINLIISIDGLEQYHDTNRGRGNFRKSITFVKKAHILGFHTEIFSVVTKESFPNLDIFEEEMGNQLGYIPRITYHPRKPPMYLLHHPTSNIFGETKGFDFLTDEQMILMMKERNVFPPKELGCYQIALTSDGKVYGCCEGTIPLGQKDEKIEDLFCKLKERLIYWEKTNTLKNCLGCSQSEFMCGIKKYLLTIQKETV